MSRSNRPGADHFSAPRPSRALAYERAWNVRDYLLSLGLEHKRFSLVIVGPNEPLDKDEVSLSSRFGDVNTYVEVFLKNE